jgi:hypothetical protein
MPRKAKTKTKPTSEELAKLVRKHHARFTRHIHGALREAGLSGVKVHSLRFSVARNAVAGSGCDASCPPGHCVLDSSGGVARWVCV